MALTAVVCLLVAVFEVIPRTSAAAKSGSEWLRIRSERVDEASFEAERSALETERARLRSRMEETSHNDSDEGHLSAVLSGLQIAARESGVRLQRIELGEASVDNYAERISISITTTSGSGHQTAAFVDLVERAEEVIQIQSFTLTGPGLEAGPTTTEFRLLAIRGAVR